MKKLTAMLLLGSWMVTAAPAEPPKVSAEQALKIATGYLREQGYEKDHYITSLSLERATLTQSRVNWIVTWTPAVPGKERQETGLQISMDGSVVRLVSKTTRESAAALDRRSIRFMR